MGRKPSHWTNLPKGMRAHERGLKVHYYLDTGGKPRKEIALGSDYVVAVQKWAELTASKRESASQHTFVDLALEYRARVFPTKAVRTRSDNEKELAWLLRFFGDPPAPLDSIEPLHVRKYMDWRAAEARSWLKVKMQNANLLAIPPSLWLRTWGKLERTERRRSFLTCGILHVSKDLQNHQTLVPAFVDSKSKAETW